MIDNAVEGEIDLPYINLKKNLILKAYLLILYFF